MEVEILKLISKYPQNFITLKEIFESDNTHFLVTTFLEGTSLSEELLKVIKILNFSQPKFKGCLLVILK